MDLIFCVSKAVNPAKSKTPTTEIKNSNWADATKMLTIYASNKPITPTTKNAPKADKSLFVEYP